MKKIIAIFIFIASIQVSYSFQFGNGNREYSTVPIKVLDNVKDIRCGQYSTYVLKNDGTVWITGSDAGYIGFDSFTKILDGVSCFVGCGFLKVDGSLWVHTPNMPVIIKNFVTKITDNVKSAVYVAYPSGFNYSGKDWNEYFFCTKKDGKLWRYQIDKVGKVLKENKVNNMPVISSYSENFGSLKKIVTKDNKLLVFGETYLPEPYYKIEEGKHFKLADNVKYVYDFFYITTKDELYGFGQTYKGWFGIETSEERVMPIKMMDGVKTVSTTAEAVIILKKDGDLYGCGGNSPNYFGELGTGDKKPVMKPRLIDKDVVAIGSGIAHIAYLKKDGSLWVCGANDLPGMM